MFKNINLKHFFILQRISLILMAENLKKRKIKISGMHCASCALNMKNPLKIWKEWMKPRLTWGQKKPHRI